MDEILSSDRTTPIGYHTSSLSLGGWVETQPSRIGSSPERMKKPKVRKFGRGATFLECHEGIDQSEARLQRYAELGGF